MPERAIGRAVLCALAIASLDACVETANDEGSTSAEATACTPVGTTSWWNQAFTPQTGRFHVDFTATPSATNIDAVVGLSDGATTKWASLAAIVRFNPQGTIDARAGSVYRADREYRYVAGTTYYIRLDVDVKSRTYSVWISAYSPDSYFAIAREYPFRSEQAAITQLSNAASFVNPETGPGALQVCGLAATTDATTADGCIVQTAGAGFANTLLASSSTVQLASFIARPQVANMDGVIGVTSGDADAYDDFAASIRFWTNGRVEARDGDTYRADIVMPYRSGQELDVRFVIDLASKTYSVFVHSDDDVGSQGEWVQLAKGYRFRPAQATVATLDRVATIIASATGRLDTCQLTGGPNPRLQAVRDGTFDVLPLSNNTAWISDGASTILLDASNRSTGSLPVGGKLALDASGSLYIARIANGTLSVASYTPALAPRWSVSYPVSGGEVGDVVVATSGQVVLSVGNGDGWSQFAPVYIVRLAADGSYLSSDALPAGTTALALEASRYALARTSDTGVSLEIYGHSGTPLTSRFIEGKFGVNHLLLAPDGHLAIAGWLDGSVDFGTGAIAPFYNSEVYWQAYVAAFTPDLSATFAARLTTMVHGLATNGGELAVAYETWTQLQYVDLFVTDWNGREGRGTSEDAFVGWFGKPGPVAIGPAGQLYLNESASLAGYTAQHFPFLVTLSL